MLATRSSFFFSLRIHPFTVSVPKMWSTNGFPRKVAGVANGPRAAVKESSMGIVEAVGVKSANVALACKSAERTLGKSLPKETSSAKDFADGASLT